MTDIEKQTIAQHRRSGLSYTQISKMMGLSINSVKAYCRRHKLNGCKGYENVSFSTCEQCGKQISQINGRKKKRFCSDKCRMLWWNGHADLVNRKANYSCTCAYCGKTFISYGKKERKYCSHECYIEDRFGGGF